MTNEKPPREEQKVEIVEKPKPVVLNFDEEDESENIKQAKMKRFEEFKQRRERQDQIRKERHSSLGSRGRSPAKPEVPSTDQIVEKSKAFDLKPQVSKGTPLVKPSNPKWIKPSSRQNSGTRNNQWVAGDSEEEKQQPTPSVVSTKAPLIPPRKALAKNSNKKIIKNALSLCVLAGQSDVQKRERDLVLEILDNMAEEFTSFLIVFKPNPGRFDFKALYASEG